jgi:SAM-dependent methyltransferase
MADWSSGYVKGIDYTYDYHRELNPAQAALPLLNAGLAPPVSLNGNACELGFGFGVSINIHAAASTAAWWGADFNPTQARHAQELAGISAAKLHLSDESFADFCHRPDLPDFDFIGLHGIWSWVSDANRSVLVDFVRRRLRPGGVLYLSYNVQPGWAQMMPMRQLMMEHAESMSAPATDLAEQIGAAIDFTTTLINLSPDYATSNPSAATCVKGLKKHSVNYLAHEYFNRDWQPMMLTEIARMLEPAKVGVACSADLSDHVDAFSLLPQQIEMLKLIPDVALRQTVRGFVVNEQFRKDYWVKGAKRLDAQERLDALRAHRIILATHPDNIKLTAGGLLANQSLPEKIYLPVIGALADWEIHTLGALESQLAPHGIGFDQLIEAVVVLSGKRDIASVQDDTVIASAQATADRFNRHVIAGAAGTSRIHSLASPLTGGGVTTPAIHLHILRAIGEGFTQPKEWAAYLWRIFQAKGARVVKNGSMLTDESENLAALEEETNTFAKTRLPVLRAFKAIPPSNGSVAPRQ